jgi:type II secretory pathway component GspD/PulD (secretin)
MKTKFMKQPNFLLIFCLALFVRGLQVLAQNDVTSSSETTDVIASNQSEEGLRMNFRNVPLEMVLDYMSEAAGFSIIAETDISGEVSVWNNRPLNKEQAVALLDSILNEKGYAAIRVGNTLKIVSSSSAQTENLPVRTGNDPADIPQSDRMVTQIIPVRYTGAVDLIENLEPLLPDNSSMTANESSNAVVLTGTENNIRRVAEIIRALDTSISGISQLKVFPLKYSDATELAEVVKSLFEAPQQSSRRGGSSRGGFSGFRFGGRGGDDGGRGRGDRGGSSGDSEALQAASRVVAVADERTNSLVVSAPDEYMPTIIQLVTEIDTNVDDITELQVFPLKFADAFEMSEILKDIFDDSNEEQTSSRGGFRFGRGGPFGGGGDRGGSRSSSNNNESSRVQAMTRVTAVPDPRTNSVIVSAASNLMTQIERMINQLDSDSSKKQKVYVYSLDNADVDNVATILRGMFESQSSNLNNRNNANRSGQNNNNPLNNRSVNQQNFGLGGAGGGVTNR